MSKVINYGELKKTVTKEGTRIITIEEPCIIKISPIDLLVEAQVVLEGTLERMGITQKIIAEVKKGVDSDEIPMIQDIIITTPQQETKKEDKRQAKSDFLEFSEDQKNDMIAFLNTVLSDQTPEDSFPISEIETVLGMENISLPLLEKEFGSYFTFVLLEDDKENTLCISKKTT